MRILAIGDITGPAGVEYLAARLWKYRQQQNIDFCVVNGENASFISGIGREAAEKLLRGGADVITGGNHTLTNRTVYGYLEESGAVLRPLNLPEGAPGQGCALVDAGGVRVLVLNALGCVHMEPHADSPYPYIDRALTRYRGEYDIAVLDFHAEATGEKVAMGYAYDGRIRVIFGTHTHVPTADCTVLPGGTGYVTDLGMCGESGGVLGMEPQGVIYRMRTHLPQPFRPAPGPVRADGVIFTLDGDLSRVLTVERVCI